MKEGEGERTMKCHWGGNSLNKLLALFCFLKKNIVDFDLSTYLLVHFVVWIKDWYSKVTGPNHALF